MRLDLFLKKTQLIKRRTIAKELVERGNVKINGKVAKPSSEVRTGDQLELHLGLRTVVVEATIELRGSKENPSFTLISDTKSEN